MEEEVYFSIREEYGFSPVNRSRGLEITSGEEPQASYILPGGEVNLYTHSPSMRDVVHPFRPSGKVIAEVKDCGMPLTSMYLAGTEKQFIQFDRGAKEMLEQLESQEYYKKIL